MASNYNSNSNNKPEEQYKSQIPIKLNLCVKDIEFHFNSSVFKFNQNKNGYIKKESNNFVFFFLLNYFNVQRQNGVYLSPKCVYQI